MEELRTLFNRAWTHVFQWKKCVVAFVALALSGLVYVFFQGLSIQSGKWIQQSLSFLPLFLSIGLLLPLGIVLIRFYHDEVKGKQVDYFASAKASAEVATTASAFALPLVLGYLALWMLLGIFMLLEGLPILGPLFEILFAFTPFILNLAAVLLVTVTVAALYFAAPILALKHLKLMDAWKLVLKRVKTDPFMNLVGLVLSLLPLYVSAKLLIYAASMTEVGDIVGDNRAFLVLKWFVIMLPFTALLAPALIFFFNFAAESHVYFQRLWKSQEES